MRLSLSLPVLSGDCLTLNYPYTLSSAIYKFIQRWIRNSPYFRLTKNMVAVIKISNYLSFLKYRPLSRFKAILLRHVTDRLQFAVYFYMLGECGPLPSKRAYP